MIAGYHSYNVGLDDIHQYADQSLPSICPDKKDIQQDSFDTFNSRYLKVKETL